MKILNWQGGKENHGNIAKTWWFHGHMIVHNVWKLQDDLSNGFPRNLFTSKWSLWSQQPKWSFNWSNYYGDQFPQTWFHVFLGDSQVALCIAKILAIEKVSGRGRGRRRRRRLGRRRGLIQYLRNPAFGKGAK